MQIGDQLLAIDGQIIQPGVNVPRYRPGIRAGDAIHYTVERNGSVFEIMATAGSRTDNLPLLAENLGMQLLSIVLWGIGLIMTIFAPGDDRRARLLSPGFLMAGVAMAAGGASGWNSFWGAPTVQKVLLSLLGSLLVTAHLTFPAVIFPKIRNKLIGVFWVISISLSVLLLIDDFLLAPQGNPIPLPGNLHLRQIVLAFFMSAWGFSVFLLARNRWLATDIDVRRQTGIILWGMVLGISPFFILTVIPYILFGEEYVNGGITILFLVFLPLAYAYVIFQGKLLHLDFIINRALVSFVVLAILLMLSIFLFGIAVLLLGLPTQLPLLGGLIVAVLVLPYPGIQRAVQVRVDRVLYGSHYDFLTVTSQISNQLAQSHDWISLVKILVDLLPQQMGILQAAILANDTGQEYSLEMGELSVQAVAMTDGLSKHLASIKKPIRLPVYEAPIEDELNGLSLEYPWARVIVPIVFEAKSMGMLCLGKRSAGEIYSDQDLLILETVALQAALAWQNVHLHELRRGLARELVRSDEDHRRSLAHDLHDTILQDLFFFKQSIYKKYQDPDLTDLISGSIQELRAIIRANRLVLLNHGLKYALQDFLEDTQKVVPTGPKIEYKIDCPDDLKLSDEETTCFFRITQEAVTNAMKHALAQHIFVEFTVSEGGWVRLAIRDDGIGLSLDSQTAELIPEHYGMAIMRERAEMIGAKLAIESHPGLGTSLTVEKQLGT